MGGIYDITGWSGGGRRPITHNLRPGQFRGMGSVNVFGEPTRVVINNNVGDGRSYFDYGYEEPSMPTWMQWMMGGGMAMNFLGQIFQAVMPHSNGIDGRGSARGEMSDNQKQDLAVYADVLKNAGCKVSGPSSSGEFLLSKKGQKPIKFNSFEELKTYIDTNLVAGDDAVAEDEAPQQSTIEQNLDTINGHLKGTGITAAIKDGKIIFKIGNNEYANLLDAYDALRQPAANTTTNTATNTDATDTQTGKYQIKNKDITWYEIAQQYKPKGVSLYDAIGALKRENGLIDDNGKTIRNDAKSGPNQKAENGYIKLPKGWEIKE
jgi:hypothetical protein